MSAENKDSAGRLTRFVTKQGKGVLLTRLWKKDAKGEKVFAPHWTRRIKRGGKSYYFHLPENKDDAEREATAIDAFLQVRSNTIEMALAKFAPEKAANRALSAKVATIGEVAKAYGLKEDVLDVKHSSARRYVGCLYRLVAIVRAHRSRTKMTRGERMSDQRRDAVGECAIDVLADHRYFSDFKTAMLAGTAENKPASKARKRTVNAYLRNVRAMFTDEARRQYLAAGLNVPPLKALEDEPTFRKVDKKYSLPEVRIINAIFDLGRELKSGRPVSEGKKAIAPDLNAYATYLLALHGGLRQQEIAHCRLAWFSETAPWRIRIQADGRFDPKGMEGETEVEGWVYDDLMSLPVASDMEIVAARAAKRPHDYLLRGSPSERTDDVFRRLNFRLRAAGMNRRLPTHELRKLFGSYIATTKGLFVAQKMLRHKSAQLTSDDYADNMVDELLRARWKAA